MPEPVSRFKKTSIYSQARIYLMQLSLRSFLLASLMALLTPFVTHAQLFEDFEDGSKNSYAAATVELSSGPWLLDDALLGSDNGDKTLGSQSVRLRAGSLAMEFDTYGAGEVRFYHANAGFSGDTGGRIRLQYSRDGGSSWLDAGDEIISPDDDLEQAVVEVNLDGDIRFRINHTAGGRISIDHFEVTEFTEETQDPRLRVEVDGSVIRDGSDVSFGHVLVGRTDEKTLTLTNTGGDDLTLSSISVTGDGFSLDGILPDVIEPGNSDNLTLIFEPGSGGAFTGLFTAASNDPETGSYEANLSGNGMDPDEPIDIADARDLPLGTLVTVSGWVTVTDQFSGPIYFQDETAGMASYYSDVMRDSELGFTLEVSEGDSIVVTGPLSEFNDLLQIAPNSEYNEVFFEIYPDGRRDIEPRKLTLEELETGEYEGQLVLLEEVQILDQGQFVGDRNYDIQDGTDTSEIRISRYTDIPGMNIPFEPVNIIGAASRFRDFVQVFPRDRSDFIPVGDAPFFVSDMPYETGATASSITFNWETDREATSEIRYGLTTEYELGILEEDGHKTTHTLTLEDLEPATVYNVQLRSAYGTDTTRTSNYLVTTSSPESATQEINVYFSQYVDHTLATFEEAIDNYNFADHLIARIDDAVHSLDLAFYSISGTVGSRIADAIVQAYNRGVDVRVIVDHTTSTDTFVNTLKDRRVPVIESDFGSANSNREGLHHNKFAVIDYSGGDPDEIWLITSSWNATDDGTTNQYQNMIEFQDVAIAGAYTREFNQMWGSDSSTPDASEALFGSQKLVVNPSTFWIGDSYVRLFFSPQGGTESAIINTLNKAEHSINLGTMLITRVGITNALFNRNAQEVTIRGVMGQPGQQGSQYDDIAEFADMHALSASEHGLFHHKYAVIDGEEAAWNGTVITGSHNWSGSANQRNDENTIIIQDSRIANLYIQEFAARYHQAGGEDDIITVDTDRLDTDLPQHFQVHQNYPNPFNPATQIGFELPRSSHVTIRIYDTLGRVVASPLSNESLPAGTHQLHFDGSSLASGIYIYRVQLDNGSSVTRAMTLIK